MIGSSLYHSQVRYPQTVTNDTTFGARAWTVRDVIPNTATYTRIGATQDPDRYFLLASASTVNNTTLSNRLRCTNFEIGVPVEAIVRGVVVTVDTYYATPNGGLDYRLVLNQASLLSGGSLIGTLKGGLVSSGANEGNSRRVNTRWLLGSNTDLWGASLTPTQVNASDFGVSFVFYPKNDTSTIEVRQVRLGVSYTVPSGTSRKQSFIKDIYKSYNSI